jgi:hypothetical protein
MAYSFTYWRNLSDSERSIYMEFYSPVINNIKVMPGNDDIVNYQTVFPSDEQLDHVLNDPENTVNNRFTDGQRNAILYWMEQHPDYMQNYYDNVAYNLDVVTEDILPYAELEDSSSSDESEDDLEVTSDSSDEEGYSQEN